MDAIAGWARNPVFDTEEPPPGPVFFAIKPEVEDALDVERTATQLRAENRLTGVPYRPELFHVSLLGIGWRPELRQEVVERARVAGAAITIPPFNVAFDRAASFGGKFRRPFVLFGGDGVAGIAALQSALIRELKKVGFGVKNHSYEPHMTLLYDRRQIAAQYIAPVRWRVREFSLIHGLHGLKQHVHLARWTLCLPSRRLYAGRVSSASSLLTRCEDGG
jgi:2'-5' RNA ligase